MVVPIRRHRRAVGTTVRRAVDDEVPGAVEEETGPATVRRVPPGLLNALPVHTLGPLGIVVVVRDVNPRQLGVALDLNWGGHGPHFDLKNGKIGIFDGGLWRSTAQPAF